MNTQHGSAGGNRGQQVQWIGPPLISGDWFDILADEAAIIIAVLADYLESAELPAFLASIQVEVMRAMTLSVYPGWLLVECQARSNNETAVLFNFMFGPNGAILLDGRPEAIHALNQLVAVDIADPQTAAEYLTFYCSAVRSKLGRFEVIATIADLVFAPETTAEQKTVVRQLLSTPRHSGGDADGLHFDTTVRYGSGLFRTRFAVPPHGRVKMLDDDELEFGAELGPEMFEGPFRIPAARSR